MIIDIYQLQDSLFSEKQWQKNEWPELLAITHSENNNDGETTIEINCFIPHTLAWFQGHYPEQPVLPGVVQTYWATELSKILFSYTGFQGINALKFINMIMPQTPIKLILKLNKDNSVSFSYVSDETTIENEIKYSTGKVVFDH